MARNDPPLQARVPQFVHDELRELEARLGGEASRTRIVAALIHTASLESARRALRAYSEELARQRRS